MGKFESYDDPFKTIMGKGRRRAFRALVEEDKRGKAIHALVNVEKIAEQIIINPNGKHNFLELKKMLDQLYINANISSAPRDIRDAFRSIYSTTTSLLDSAISQMTEENKSILERTLRGSSSL